MNRRRVSIHREEWDLRQPFRISGNVWTTAPGIVVQIGEKGCIGRGEAQGVYYQDETPESMLRQVESITDALQSGMDRDDLQHALPAGGARNAVDCALWDLECKLTGETIWQRTGIEPGPVTTVFTIGLEDTPAAMAMKAREAADSPVLKIKLNDDRPVERLEAIRAARPDATLVVDANQGWTFELLRAVLPRCAELGLAMIEQPLPRGQDAALEGFDSPVLLAADESCLDRSELGQALARYGMVNIKLDKTGGLTEALALARAAKVAGCQLMVGNMVGTSLAMAPSFVVAQLCDFVDIDGPLLLKHDHPNGLAYRNGVVSKIDTSLWG
jgi:L-alanine-DL-glutamate epimerase-like enolase superfamily enzyme